METNTRSPSVGAPLESITPVTTQHLGRNSLVQIDDITSRPPRSHLAPLNAGALETPSGGTTPTKPAHPTNAPVPTLSPIRGARPLGTASLPESPSKLQNENAGDVVGNLAMVARRRRQSSIAATSPTPQETERTDAYAQLYGHNPTPPPPMVGAVRPHGSLSPEAAPTKADYAAFDLLDPDTDGSPTW